MSGLIKKQLRELEEIQLNLSIYRQSFKECEPACRHLQNALHELGEAVAKARIHGFNKTRKNSRKSK